MPDPYKGLLAKILEDHPRLRATRLSEMIRARGYPGSVVQLPRSAPTSPPCVWPGRLEHSVSDRELL